MHARITTPTFGISHHRTTAHVDPTAAEGVTALAVQLNGLHAVLPTSTCLPSSPPTCNASIAIQTLALKTNKWTKAAVHNQNHPAARSEKSIRARRKKSWISLGKAWPSWLNYWSMASWPRLVKRINCRPMLIKSLQWKEQMLCSREPIHQYPQYRATNQVIHLSFRLSN